MALFDKLRSAIDTMQKDHAVKTAAEEQSLMMAKTVMTPVDVLQYKFKIDQQRANRIKAIEDAEDNLIKFELGQEKYINDLKAKTKSAYSARLNKLYTNTEFPPYLRGRRRKIKAEPGYHIGWAWGSSDKYANDSDWTFITRAKPNPGSTSYMMFYKIPIEVYVNKYVLNPDVVDATKDFLTSMNPIKSYPTLQELRWGPYKDSGYERSSMNRTRSREGKPLINMQSIMYKIVEDAFPSITQYVGNEAGYPNFVDFMENVPWPDSKQMDYIIKKYVGLGTKDFAINNIKLFEKVFEKNLDQNQDSHTHILLPKNQKVTDTYYKKEIMPTRLRDSWIWGPSGGEMPPTIPQNLPEAHYGLPKKASSYDPISFKQHIKYQPYLLHSYSYGRYPGPRYPQLPYKHAKLLTELDEAYRKYSVKLTQLQIEKGYSQTQAKEALKSEAPLRYDDFIKKHNIKIRDVVPGHSYNPVMYGTYTRDAKAGDPKSTFRYEAKDTSSEWYWPRPKDGYIYIPNWGYINPATYTGAYRTELATALFQQNIAKKRIRIAKNHAKNVQMANSYMNAVRELANGHIMPLIGFGYAYGGPHFANAMNVWMVMVSAASGGAAAGVAAAAGFYIDANHGDQEWSNYAKAILEAVAISYFAESAFSDAMIDVTKKYAIKIAAREIGQETGMDRTIIGQMVLDVAGRTTLNVSEGMDFEDSIAKAADKSWRVAAAKSNPYAALIIAGATEIEKNGLKGIFNGLPSFSDPQSFFESLDFSKLGSEIVKTAKGIKSDDLKKMIGLMFAVKSGAVSGEDAALMVGQEAAVRNIDRFYEDKPVKELTPEEKRIAEATKKVANLKAIASGSTKLIGGKTPTRAEMKAMGGAAEDILKKIASIFPEGSSNRSNAFKFISNIGLPNLPFSIPGIEIPEWAKITVPGTGVTGPSISGPKINLPDIDLSVDLPKFKIENIVKDLLPKDFPLLPITPGTVGFNYIDTYGVLHVRESLKFPYDHPMLATGSIKKKYSARQKQYIDDQMKELDLAFINMKKQQTALVDIQVQQMQLG